MSYTAPANGFRTFLILWVSQSISVFGSALTMFALNIWLVQVVYPAPEQQADLAWALAAMGMAAGVAGLIWMPLGGALADRVDRKRLMFLCDLASGAIMTAVAVLMATGLLRFWMVLPMMVVFVLVGSIHNSAFDASYAMLVPEKHLPRANGMMQSMWALSSILSPGVAATLVALPVLARQGQLPDWLDRLLGGLSNGAALAIGIDALTFFLAAAILPFLFIPSPERKDLAGGQRKSIRADVQIGAVYIWRRRPLLWLLGTYAIFNLLLPMGVFLPLLVKQGLAADWAARGYSYETALALINTAASLGGVAGGVLVSVWGGTKSRRVMVVLLSVLIGGVFQVLVGLTPYLYVAAAGMFLMCVGFPIANAHSQAVWQGQVPRELQGRVFSVRRVIGQSMSPLGQVLAGWLAGAMAPGLGFALLGVISFVVCLASLFNPVLMRVEDKEYLERMAARAAGDD